MAPDYLLFDFVMFFQRQHLNHRDLRNSPRSHTETEMQNRPLDLKAHFLSTWNSPFIAGWRLPNATSPEFWFRSSHHPRAKEPHFSTVLWEERIS